VIVLSALRALAPRQLLPVANDVGTASSCLFLVRRGKLGSENDQMFARELDAGTLGAEIDECGARVVTCDDAEYPPALRTIHDPPMALFVRGGEVPAVTEAVAIVGARTCSDLGRELARETARGLGAVGMWVVSGAARGIDSAAHEGALDAGGRTLAVLGCGIDVGYPRASRNLLTRIAERGTIVSEYAPGVPPEPFRFPARNRIVAGLCAATVVVEGAEGSGSGITGDHALEFGREVFALPGAVNNPLSYVPLRLIRDGATMIRGADDLLEDLRIDADLGVSRAELTLAEEAALDLLVGPTLPEHVGRGLGLSVPQVVALLMDLEMRGLVRSVGGRFEPTLRAVRGRAP
jgi:DNA processing protein